MKKYLITAVGILAITNLVTLFSTAKQDNPSQYQWLNPELQSLPAPVIDKSAYLNFRLDLEKTIEQTKKEGRLNHVAVFFRDLVNGPSFSINPNEGFVPSSLLKLPLAVTYLDLADENKISLKTELVADNFSLNLIQVFPPAEEVISKKSYSIQELVYRLIANSDNRAWELLYKYIYQFSPDNDLLLETYKNLGIINVDSEDITKESLSVKSYASIFRLLYNASYLSKESSDALLSYLAKSTFNEGLKSGVPANIAVAHKFGERFIDDKKQLHDCGIIYYPGNPYLLCIMTKGKNFNDLADIIAAISKTIYEEVNSRRL